MSRPIVLLTGATGFIGGTLLRVARRDGFDRSFEFVTTGSSRVEGFRSVGGARTSQGLFTCDANDFAEAGVARADHVIHLGAFIPKSGADSGNVDGCVANILNTRALLDCLPEPPRRFVFASSVDVYGPSSQTVTEQQPCCPRTLYGQSKLFCETMLASIMADEAYAHSSLRILRIGHTYGPGEGAFRKFIPETIRRLLRGEPPQLTTNGEEKRCFIHVEDCCRMILAALNAPEVEGPINVASRRAESLNEVAQILCRIAEERGGKRMEPRRLAGAQSGHDAVFDVGKMERTLGLEQISLESGLASEFDHFAQGVP